MALTWCYRRTSTVALRGRMDRASERSASEAAAATSQTARRPAPPASSGESSRRLYLNRTLASPRARTRSRVRSPSSLRCSRPSHSPPAPRPSAPHRHRGQARQDLPHRGDLRGEPQLRQPVRRLGRRQRSRRRGRGAHARRSPRTASPYKCLKQNDANLTSPPAGGDVQRPPGRGTRSTVTSPNTYFTIDDYIPSTAITCPPTRGAASRARNAGSIGHGHRPRAGRLHA